MSNKNTRRMIQEKFTSTQTHLNNAGERLGEISAMYGDEYAEYSFVVNGFIEQLALLVTLIDDFTNVI